jgi:DNA replication protein DnaC
MSSLPEQVCANCGGTGLRPGKQPGNAYVRCTCLTERVIRAAIPPKYHRASLTDFGPVLIETKIIPWLGNPTEGMVLIGEAGSGKTHLACAIVRALYEIGKKAKFCRASDLYLEIRQSYHGHDLGEMAIMARYCSTPTLILDDIGAGSLSDHERRILLDVLDRRGNDCRPTVVTTNLSLDQIRGLMDERISSRLKEYLAVAFTGADRRGKRA